jgi:hypothetical protein
MERRNGNTIRNVISERHAKMERNDKIKRNATPIQNETVKYPPPKKNNYNISPDYAMIQMTICI